MYAIVKAGGHQEKVEVGDEITVNRLAAKKGGTVEFPVVLFVDGSKTVIAAQDLAKIHVEGEVIDDEAKGPKVVIQKFHNKTGGARRQGHRQKLSVVKITKIA
ncbi:MAG: 50S ribosomal protein L21 [Aeriscardovia sp.]|nr:50S ribosomal protein L21 [Aeriscardovia sp.]MBQ3308995.1 50S ribosomal protein L21 [Aeriscardovia sp.]MBQ5505025.1 50S ribosomal protein L21 [Aeriscardovia sp.]MBQ9681569.1 50S ribosomal protein L21 [Aeriscardovia sp.]MBR2673676.1 50S ribosomal protein L21 [Aeriscardovia sp.]